MSADSAARSSNVVGAKAAAAEKAALAAAAQRAAAAKAKAAPVKRYGSADALARTPSVVGNTAAKAEAAAVNRAAPVHTPIYQSADSMAMSPNIVGEEAAAAEAAARSAGEARGPYVPPPPAITYRTSGSGRSTGDITSGGSGLAPVPAAFVPPESVTAAPAAIQPPAVVADAAPSEVNVPGESFTSVGTPGSFGQYDRLRQSRGPRTGMSVTPEMIRRAASNRLG